MRAASTLGAMTRTLAPLVLAATVLVGSLSGCSCGGTVAEPDAHVTPDAAAIDGATSTELDALSTNDAPLGPDVFESPDAPSLDAPSGADAACTNGMEGPMPRGICDGRGMTGCRLWAEENASGARAMAICIQAGDGGCARADVCTDARDVSTCTCGGGPACEAGEVCTLDDVTGRAACSCVTRLGP
jgi:hypothetical protein